ncbi:hypothetical protein D043_0617A, partial [Vibrio parahaemolyticus EKP-021]
MLMACCSTDFSEGINLHSVT